MARDRKRARDRRASAARPEDEAPALGQGGTDHIPGPLGHAAPDAELAEAQLAVGRPDLAGEDEGEGPEAAPDELQDVPVAGRESRRQRRLARIQQGGEDADGEPEPEQAPVPAERPTGGGNRVLAFLGASWRELQRVQWPDRQQVAQATGVVLVFVVIAGLYLGLTGEIASRIVQALL